MLTRRSTSGSAPALVRIQKTDKAKRIIYGEVYAPYVLDTWGEFMLPEDIEKMAHRFMELNLKGTIDQNHDEQATGCYPVESFIAQEGDPMWTPGAWVLGTKITDEDVWQKVLRGEIGGYSFQAWVQKVPCVIEVSFVTDNIGVTEPAADGHVHFYYATLDDNGTVAAGRTSTDQGHSHAIAAGTATEPTNGHSHRFVL